jgi:hypothetical protein
VDFLERGRKRNPDSWDLIFHEGWILEHYAAGDPKLRTLAETHYRRNPHDRAASLFRRHVEFPDSEVLRPYRRCAGYASRAWARDLRAEAVAARKARVRLSEEDAAARAEALRRELRLLREALQRYAEARGDWDVVLRMSRERPGPAWRAFGDETEKLMAGLRAEADEADAEARQVEEELARLGGQA